MTKTYTTKEEVLREADKILGHSLRDVIKDDKVNIVEIEKSFISLLKLDSNHE